MTNSGAPTENLSSSRSVTSRRGKWFIRLAAALFIFSVGVGVGDGRIWLPFNTNPAGVAPGKLDLSSVDGVYSSLRNNYDGKLDEAKLLDGLKQGLTTATGDPYTQYLNADDAKKFTEQLNNEFSGIGAELGQDKDKNIVVIAPIAGTPASKAGIKPKDIIGSINKETTVGMSVADAVTKIRGPKGTKVTLQVIRNREQVLDLTITREDISVPSVESKVLDGGIGYLKINTFSDDSGLQASLAAQALRDAKVKAVILDMRGNPGGRVDAAVQVANLWLPKGKIILQEKRGGTVRETHTSKGGDAAVLEGMPTRVLIDGGSASASEIVAGALRDNNAAKLIGEKSYGKGSVQQVINLRDGSELKVTVARWFRPNGKNIDKQGIEPDQAVKPSDEAGAAVDGKDLQLDAAVAALK